MTWRFTVSDRPAMIADLQSQPLDLLIIGGGVTGVGILLDAHTRGMRAALVEMQDFAAGTSSRSTKLIHGGLRYLKQLDVQLVAEVGEERAIVYENGPHVTTPLWMLLPIVAHGTYGKLLSSIGLFAYDRLAKVKPQERRTMLSAKAALTKEPLLKAQGLKGAGFYVEYRTDDARLTLEIVKEAVERGAVALNYSKVQNLIYDQGKATGANVLDLLTGETNELQARAVINATGPWVDQLREMDHSKEGQTMHLTKGVHVVVDQSRFPLSNPVYFDVPDGRMIFAIPRDGKTYMGTTDTDYQGDPREPVATKADLDYILDCANGMFPSVRLKKSDIESFWAGVRPLIHEEGKSPSEISRKEEVFVSKSNLVTIAGGKLTGYRKMADKVVSLIAEQLASVTGVRYPRCQTKSMEISGGKFGGSRFMPEFVETSVREGLSLGLTELVSKKLVQRYGTNVNRLFDIIRTQGSEAEGEGLSLEVFATLNYGISDEMVVTPADYFIRRTSALFFDAAWVKMWKEPVIAYMEKRFAWSQTLTEKYRDELQAHILSATQWSE